MIFSDWWWPVFFSVTAFFIGCLMNIETGKFWKGKKLKLSKCVSIVANKKKS